MDENRKFPRYSIKLPALFKLAVSDSSSQAMTILNVSADGLCFISPIPLVEGMRLNLDVNLSATEKVQLKVEVMWAEKTADGSQNMAGVFIIETTSQDEERFVKYYCQQMLTTIKKRNTEHPL